MVLRGQKPMVMLIKREDAQLQGEAPAAMLDHTPATRSPLGPPPPELTNIHLLPLPPSSLPLLPHFPTSQILPYCPLGQGPRKSPREWRIYLWTSLFHEALLEVVPGDEGHELGEERHTLTPLPHTKEPEVPHRTWLPKKGEVWNGEGCVRMVQGVIFGMDATLTFQQSQITAPQMSAELTSTAKSWFQDLV